MKHVFLFSKDFVHEHISFVGGVCIIGCLLVLTGATLIELAIGYTLGVGTAALISKML